MKYLAMTAVALSVSAGAALANLDPSATGNQTTAAAAATAPATEAPMILVQRRYYRYGARRCLENLGYGRRGTYGCG